MWYAKCAVVVDSWSSACYNLSTGKEGRKKGRMDGRMDDLTESAHLDAER